MEVFKNKDGAVISIKENKNAKEIINALRLSIDLQKEYGSKYITLTFSKPSKIYSRKNYRKVDKQNLIISIGHKTGQLCYSTTGRTGYLIESSNIEYENITSIEVVNRFSKKHQEDESFKLKKAIEKALKIRFDKETWSNLKTDSFDCSNGRFYDIRKIFDKVEPAHL